jgi:alpha-1,2-glucosyltransferase
MKTQAASPPRSRLYWHAATLLLVAVIVLLEFRYMSTARLLSDESFNFRQITRFLGGDITMEPLMNVIPGYHALVAAAMFVLGKTGLFSARLFSTAISLASVALFYLLTWKALSRPSLVKTLQYAFLPLLFPFFALVYTDVLALFLVLLAFYLVLWKRYTLAGLVGILSILARTNNVSWFAFLFVYVYYREYGLDWRAVPRSLRKTWAFWLGFGLFLIFFIVNGGVAITNKSMQPSFRFESGNIFFLLFLFFFLFLPLNIANFPRIVTLIKKRPWVIAALLLVFLFYLLSFRSDHPYNQARPDYYLRNQLLMTVTSGLGLKSLFFLPVAYGLLSLGVTRLRQKPFYWLYPFTVLSLVPFWLIEPRYYFVPFSLFILFKEERSPLVEALTLFLYIPASILLVYLMRAEIMFI